MNLMERISCGSAFAIAALLVACSSEESAPVAEVVKSPSSPSIATLPFTVEAATLNDQFEGDIKLATVYVKVAGGTTDEWAATAIGIAEDIATYGTDSIEVAVIRADISSKQGRFREGAHVYFSPNPKRSVWRDGEAWKVLRANPEYLTTQRDVDISEGYYALNQELLDKGRSEDQADKEAGAVIAKKYHLSKDWRLPSGTFWDDIPRNSLSINPSGMASSLAFLAKCLKGDVVRMTSSCDV